MEKRRRRRNTFVRLASCFLGSHPLAPSLGDMLTFHPLGVCLSAGPLQLQPVSQAPLFPSPPLPPSLPHSPVSSLPFSPSLPSLPFYPRVVSQHSSGAPHFPLGSLASHLASHCRPATTILHPGINLAEEGKHGRPSVAKWGDSFSLHTWHATCHVLPASRQESV